ncbi:MAG TPA: hypothetical protein VHO47_03130 [Candidatus Babeliales bacterium]|nr:hypothetical protein [Candidatus Babeliales bacterium]
MKNIHQAFIVIITCILIAAGLYLATPIDEKPVNKFNEQLATFEKKAWDSLATVGVNKDECLAEIIPIEKQYNKTHAKKNCISQKLSPKTIKLAKEVLSSFGINPDSISIQPIDSHSPAEVEEDTLFINEKELHSLTENAQKFVLGHEAQHILHKDCFCKAAIDNLSNQKLDWESPRSDYPLNEFSRFIEWRADVKAALTGPEYAQGYIEFSKMGKETEPYDDEETSHPLFKNRVAMAKEIYASMQTA